MKILIIGAAGFIGSHLYEKLKKDKHEVVGIDNFFHSSSHPIIKDVEYADVRYYQDIESYIKWADIVYHLAAQIHVDKSITNPQETLDINVTGTLNVLEAVKKYNKKMVFASSSEVYGTQKCQMTELHQLDCQSPYAASKVAGDRLCKSYCDTYGTQVAILRNFNTFGSYQADESYGGVIAIFTRLALQNKPLTIFGDGTQERDYMSIKDAIKGYEFCIEKELWGKPVNVGTGKTISIKEIAKKIIELTGSKSKIIYGDPRPGEVQRLCADISFAEKNGFEISTNFNDNLKEYVKWYKKDYLACG
jgi:nucleoside-diphosphate-sugar epimerase